MKNSDIVNLISSWERDPEQEFSQGERIILEQRWLVRAQVEIIL